MIILQFFVYIEISIDTTVMGSNTNGRHVCLAQFRHVDTAN